MQRIRIVPVLSGPLFTMAGLLGLLAADSVTWATHPETPCPCAADGTCRAKTDTWGVWNTQWRPWPGDRAGVAPTVAAPTQSDDEEDGLMGLERPEPSKESQAGPERQEREEEEGLGDGTADPLLPGGEPAAEPLPVLEPLGLRSPAVERSLPRFPNPAQGQGVPVYRGAANPQRLPNMNNQLSNPAASSTRADQQFSDSDVRPAAHASQILQDQTAQTDNGPPSMPNSLRRVAHLTGLLQPLPPVESSQGAPASRLRIRTDRAVTPTSAEAPTNTKTGSTDNGGIRIVNPAAAYIAEPGKGGLQQAIYFEGAGEQK